MNKVKMKLEFAGSRIEGVTGDFIVTHRGAKTKKNAKEVFGDLNRKHYFGTLGQALTHILHWKLAEDAEIDSIEAVLRKLHELEWEFKSMEVPK